MRKITYTFALILGTVAILSNPATAREIQDKSAGKNNPGIDQGTFGQMMKMAGCEPPTAQVDLDINNVRTTILNGGDMWWNLNSARYEIPKQNDPSGIKKHSLFSGALWIGGLSSGNLKLAAQTYRQGSTYQGGTDFWSGPLDVTNVSIDPTQCLAYDKIFKVTRAEIESFKALYASGVTPNSVDYQAIYDWPGNGNTSQGQEAKLAPFINVGGGTGYEPFLGDYPDISGDQALWWVYNDVGNIHSQTTGVPIGLELQTMAFAFGTNDEVNNMTFYQTKIINRSFSNLDQTWFGQWVDPDLGNYADDYVGCDVGLSLGYCYNGDDDDEGILGYGLNPPTVGIDFFQGPVADQFDGVDNDRDGKIDEVDPATGVQFEEIIMSQFVYYNNSNNNVTGDPRLPGDYYGFLRGFWKNGQHITFGGTGLGGTQNSNFMFPGETDPNFKGQNWTEKSSGNPPSDRRFVQSAGAFTLKAGAVNFVTVGAVWARSTSGGATGSLNLLKLADKKAQKLFDNQFKITDGPRIPDVIVEELDRELVIILDNTETTENYAATVINTVVNDSGLPVVRNVIYKFEGYQIYQLKNSSVTLGELDNIERARLIAQVDVRNKFGQLINRIFDPKVQEDVPVEKVAGKNEGIVHTFKITTDAFATGNDRLINFKSYIFLVVPYAADSSGSDNEQYLAGRLDRNGKPPSPVIAVPHKSDPKGGGTKLNSVYGSGPVIQRIEGTGNGGNVLELSQESIDKIVATNQDNNPIYLGGKGPLGVRVINPLKVPLADFELYIDDSSIITALNPDSLSAMKARWKLIMLGSPNDTIYSDTTLAVGNEQVIPKWGLAVTIKQSIKPGNTVDLFDNSNGYLESSVEWADISKQWLAGVPDIDGPSYLNWIRSGDNGRQTNCFNSPDNGPEDYEFDFGGTFFGPCISLDPNEQYEKVINRTMAPYRLAARALRSNGRTTYGPAWANTAAMADNKLSDLASIDLVFTPDKSKWTRCVVVELAEDDDYAGSVNSLSEGGATKMSMRRHVSLDINGNPEPGDTGRSWFPGYAINLETGQRLNIMFGEDSWLKGENGADMIWNPTSNFFTNLSEPLFGGKHYIYVMGASKLNNGIPPSGYTGTIYDEGVAYQSLLSLRTTIAKRYVYSQAMWVMMSMMAPNFSIRSWNDGLVPTEAKVRVRVKKPYGKFDSDGNSSTNEENKPNYKFSTKEIAVEQSMNNGKNAIDLINIVPNPYYGAAGGVDYESNQLATGVKLTNLPRKCTITIYTLNGTLIKTIKKDDEITYSNWDLKNNVNVPIASGLYIIHVDAGELGEKVLKWFGVMRQMDLDTF